MNKEKEDKPLISIIVPIYNVEKYLKKCLDSIVSQTYSELEIILVNDGSTDKSLEICYEYKKKDSRIIIINKANGGLSSARNAGIDICKGHYLSFVDSDDYIHTNYVEKMLETALEFKADIVYSGVYHVEDNKKISKIKRKIPAMRGCEAINKIYDDNNMLYNIACNKLFNRNLFEKERFPLGKLHEDYFTIYKLIYSADVIIGLEECLYYYIKREGSICTNPNDIKSRKDYIEAELERVLFFKNIRNSYLYHKSEKRLFYFIAYLIIDYKYLRQEYELKTIAKRILNDNYYSIFEKIGVCLKYIIAIY